LELVGIDANCRWCHQRFFVCRPCWRGQAYCSPDCRQDGTQARRREAGRRYQASEEGRQHHRKRQSRRRSRAGLKPAKDAGVTHRGTARLPRRLVWRLRQVLPRRGRVLGPSAPSPRARATYCPSSPLPYCAEDRSAWSPGMEPVPWRPPRRPPRRPVRAGAGSSGHVGALSPRSTCRRRVRPRSVGQCRRQ
jgi:hypothetical protein